MQCDGKVTEYLITHTLVLIVVLLDKAAFIGLEAVLFFDLPSDFLDADLFLTMSAQVFLTGTPPDFLRRKQAV